LYKGGEFKGEKNFSRMISTLAVCLMYSSGMPVLYIVGFMFFTLTYFVNKLMLFSFYQKTTTLSRVIPNYANEFLNMLIAVHLITAFFMMSNPLTVDKKSLEVKDSIQMSNSAL